MTTLPNKEKALALVRLGFAVIPCREDKVARLSNWDTTILNTEALVNTYWYGEHDPIVAVHAGASGLAFLDIDENDSKSGSQSIKDAGLDVPTPTISYQTRSGGWHYVYKARNIDVNGVANIDGLQGVDRRTGKSYAIWWGPVPTQDEVDSLAEAPMWLYGSAKTPEKKEFNGEAWFNSLPDGDFSEGVQKVLSRIPSEIDHDTVIRLQYALIGEAAKGGVGVPKALELLKNAYLRDEFNTPEYQKEWADGLSKLVLEDAERLVVEADEEDKFEADVESAVYKRKVAKTADRRIREENYEGTIAWDWADLENVKVEYTIDQLLYKDSQNGLVGRSQLGKTHLLVSLMCHMATGKPWFNNLFVKQQRVLFVAGEGKGGIVGRFKDWCEAYEVDFDTIKPYVKIATDVDLSLEVSLESLQKTANEFKPDLIILDTLSATTSIENENDAADMAEVLANGRKVHPNAMVMWVHHPSEATKFQQDPKPRGSSVFKSNLDNMMTLTVDDSFAPNSKVEPYSNGNEVRFLTLSTDDDKHGGKSKEGAPVTIKGLYLWEYKRGHVVMAQMDGGSTHRDNIIINKVFLESGKKELTAKQFWAKADELGLKNSEDPMGGWTSEKSATRMLDKAEGRGELESNRNAGKATLYSIFDYAALQQWAVTHMGGN